MIDFIFIFPYITISGQLFRTFFVWKRLVLFSSSSYLF